MPEQPKTVRCQTIVATNMLYRNKEDGRIYYESIVQCDLKLNLSQSILNHLLGTGLGTWFKSLNQFLKSDSELLKTEVLKRMLKLYRHDDNSEVSSSGDIDSVKAKDGDADKNPEEALQFSLSDVKDGSFVKEAN